MPIIDIILTWGKPMIFKEVKKAMIDQDVTVTRLAEITGYKRCHVSNVINGRMDSPRAKKVIALALRRDYDKLWGRKSDSE